MAEQQDNSSLLSIEDLQRIDKTQAIREMLIDELSDGGTKAPKDNERLNSLISVLDSSDATVHKFAKLRVEKDKADSDGALADQLALLLSNISHEIPESTGINTTKDEDLPEVDDISLETVPGEMDIGPESLTYDKFMADTKRNTEEKQND